jgi:hypothetical protein
MNSEAINATMATILPASAHGLPGSLTTWRFTQGTAPFNVIVPTSGDPKV